MQEWTVESPQVIDVADDVRSLAVRLVAGQRADVLAFHVEQFDGVRR